MAIIMKFGGTSVGGAQQIEIIGELVRTHLSQKPVVVVSAVSGTTDLLLQAFVAETLPKQTATLRQIEAKHSGIIDTLWPTKKASHSVHTYLAKQLALLRRHLKTSSQSKEERDAVLSFGETMSSFIVTDYLRQQGIVAKQIVASEIFVTNSNFGSAEIIEAPTKIRVDSIIAPLPLAGMIPVVTGFIAADAKGRTTTLGRGGSDYSASLIGYFLQAEEIQIWTDVDGMFTTDPRLLKDAQLLEQLSFQEASELAAFGAKILHPKTIKPAVNAGIPVRILNTFHPESSGTLIARKTANLRAVTAIAYKKQVTLIDLYATEMLLQEGFLAKILAIFAKHHISIDLVSASEASVSLTLDNDNDFPAVVTELSKLATVNVLRNFGIVSLIGSTITESPSTIRNIFSVLESQNISVKMISLGAFDINISLVIPTDMVITMVTELHKTFITAEKDNSEKLVNILKGHN